MYSSLFYKITCKIFQFSSAQFNVYDIIFVSQSWAHDWTFQAQKKMFGKHINNLKWFKPTKICCPLFVYLSVFMFKSHLLKRLKKQSVETTWLCFEPKRQGVYLPVLHSHTEFTENVTLRSDLSNILFLIPLLAIFRNLVMIDAVCFFLVSWQLWPSKHVRPTFYPLTQFEFIMSIQNKFIKEDSHSIILTCFSQNTFLHL